MKLLPFIFLLCMVGPVLAVPPAAPLPPASLAPQPTQPVSDVPLSLKDFFGKPWPPSPENLSFDDVKDVLAVPGGKKRKREQPASQTGVRNPVTTHWKEQVAPPVPSDQARAWKELNSLFRISAIQRWGTKDGIVTLQAIHGTESYSFRLYQPRRLEFPNTGQYEIETITLNLVRMTPTTVQFQITELNSSVYESASNPVWEFHLANP